MEDESDLPLSGDGGLGPGLSELLRVRAAREVVAHHGGITRDEGVRKGIPRGREFRSLATGGCCFPVSMLLNSQVLSGENSGDRLGFLFNRRLESLA